MAKYFTLKISNDGLLQALKGTTEL